MTATGARTVPLDDNSILGMRFLGMRLGIVGEYSSIIVKMDDLLVSEVNII
jgi:hypothetical protein